MEPEADGRRGGAAAREAIRDALMIAALVAVLVLAGYLFVAYL